MDTKTFLDELLKAGRELANQGQSIAEKKLDLGASNNQREATLSGMKTGAIAAGALALLLGTKTGRNVTSSALKLGSLAAVGGVAWKAYQNYQAKAQLEGTENTTVSVDKLEDEAANERSVVLLKAMIAAAKADGHVDEAELIEINKQVDNLGLTGDVERIVKEELAKPLNLEEIAALAGGEEAKAAEVYLVSAVVTDQENEKERQYLADLAKAMNIPNKLLAELNAYNEDDKGTSKNTEEPKEKEKKKDL
ncbi:MAG: tellurite resistance TerB family protein [Cocleimonas sp.]|nr:tellurite resistance TerB family protein [Cocleimonas sp.]